MVNGYASYLLSSCDPTAVNQWRNDRNRAYDRKMTPRQYPRVRVDLDVLIAPANESRLAQEIRSSVESCAPEPSFTHSESTWQTTTDEDLARQWEIEQDAPLGDRRVRQFSMDVCGAGVDDLVDEIGWAAIDAVCPTARDEDRRLDAGEKFVGSADEFPWSSATRVISSSGLE